MASTCPVSEFRRIALLCDASVTATAERCPALNFMPANREFTTVEAAHFSSADAPLSQARR
jgi:hypothetical protein